MRCLACATEQEAPEAGGSATCEICGTPLPGSSGVSDATDEIALVETTDDGSSGDDGPRRPPPRFEELLAAPTGGAGKEIDELVDQEKRVVTILSLVPFWGPWRLWQSDLHAEGEKVRWSVVSLALTFSALALLVAQIPGAAERTEAARERIATDFDALTALVETYRDDAGEHPGSEAWQSSVERGDARFFDPWNRPYLYRLEPDAFVLGTLGRDGAVGGSGEDADVSRTVPIASRAADEPG